MEIIVPILNGCYKASFDDTYYVLNYASQNSYVEILTPVPRNVTVFRDLEIGSLKK